MTPRYIYFAKPIGFNGPIKIGCSEAPAERLLTLAVWSPFPLELLGYVPGSWNDENFLHRSFAHLHSHREWFRAAPDLLNAIEKVLTCGGMEWARENLHPSDEVKSPLTRRRTDEQKHRMSYSHRIEWARRRLRTDEGYFSTPQHISRIMDKWRGHYRRRDGVTPSAEEFVALDAYLANPSAQATFHRFQALKKPVYPAPSQEVA